jgi:hypothetical protein
MSVSVSVQDARRRGPQLICMYLHMLTTPFWAAQRFPACSQLRGPDRRNRAIPLSHIVDVGRVRFCMDEASFERFPCLIVVLLPCLQALKG